MESNRPSRNCSHRNGHPDTMARRRECDDARVEARSGRSQESGFEEFKKQEVGQMACAELQLEAICSFALRCSHDTSVIDENVQGLALLVKICGGSSYAIKRVEIHL